MAISRVIDASISVFVFSYFINTTTSLAIVYLIGRESEAMNSSTNMFAAETCRLRDTRVKFISIGGS